MGCPRRERWKLVRSTWRLTYTLSPILSSATPAPSATTSPTGSWPSTFGCEGADVLVVTSGICTEEAMRARAAFAKAGLSIRHLHLHTVKPFDAEALLNHVNNVTRGVVTLENHVTEGGIGSLVAEVMADAGVGKRLMRLGLRDTDAHGGSRPYLMWYYGLDALALVKGIESVLGVEFDITEDDLDAARVDDVHSLVNAEAL
ncbi:MAG: hypothetical protein F4213_04415 [Boseongicola sp. SB0677_bin_26]|nr:hypothetical protein [Boseongicola sp. SB0665_bin_10]MYG25252.1 hypothetical protein [Boseongicola sp. SB0677_bin_26]